MDMKFVNHYWMKCQENLIGNGLEAHVPLVHIIYIRSSCVFASSEMKMSHLIYHRNAMIKLLNNQFRLDALVLYGLRLIHGSFYVSDAFDIRIIDHLYII